MAEKVAFVYDDFLAQHSLGENHPMKPIRLRYTYELLDAYHAFDAPEVMVVGPRLSTDEELLSYHTHEYLEAVQHLSRGSAAVNPASFNFGPGDNPAYEGMYQAAAWSTGASLKGVDLLASGEVSAALSISGGLHHAMPTYAAGFCVFNDPVIAIKSMLSRGMRVAYVDVDCHHGDGVQHAFYDTDEVLTISVHESGAFLYPGTGFTQETGVGRGKGYSVNLPLYPYTTDDVYVWAFREAVVPLIEGFRPDALVTQLGIDSHYLDPIAHLALTVQGFSQVVAELSLLAPMWLALGGGGYNLHAVARAWTTAYGIMSRQPFCDEIPESYRVHYGVSNLKDVKEPQITAATRKDSKVFAERSTQEIRRLIFPTHGLRSH